MFDALALTRDFQLAQDFLRAYHASRRGLVTLGILRSERVVQGDYAEWIVSRVLGLKLAASAVQKGFDAIDDAGRRYQVKSRIVDSVDTRTSFDFADPTAEFDFLIGVLFSPSLEVLAIVRVPAEVALRLCRLTATTTRLRWNRKNAADPGIEFLYRAQALEPIVTVPEV